MSIDSYIYYGTDDMYLNYLARFLKPGAPVGIAQVGLTGEMSGEIPTDLREWWAQDQPWSFHSAAWWERHWGRTGILDIEVADTLTDGWRLWLDWLQLIAPDNATEIAAVQADAGRYLGYVRVVGRRRADAPLYDRSCPSRCSTRRSRYSAGRRNNGGQAEPGAGHRPSVQTR